MIPADLVTFTEEILNGKIHFLCIIWKESLRKNVSTLFLSATMLRFVHCFIDERIVILRHVLVLVVIFR